MSGKLWNGVNSGPFNPEEWLERARNNSAAEQSLIPGVDIAWDTSTRLAKESLHAPIRGIVGAPGIPVEPHKLSQTPTEVFMARERVQRAIDAIPPRPKSEL